MTRVQLAPSEHTEADCKDARSEVWFGRKAREGSWWGMDRNRDVTQQQTVDLDRGLFWIRYQGADDEMMPPTVTLAAAPGYEDSVEFILHPDSDHAILWQPGSSLAAKVTDPARVFVTVRPQRPSGSRAASVKVESITQGIPISFDKSAPVGDGGVGSLQLLGHVAGIGDVVVGPNEWVAGPATPARIEGLSLVWDNKPADVELRYAVKSPNQGGPPQLVNLQTFSGTRGRAQPITGVVLELSGRKASQFQFVAEALFLSSPTLRAVGQKIVLGGPTGREPLVGFRIEIQQTNDFERQNNIVPPATSSAIRPSSRVRVYRSKPKQGEES